MTVFKFDHCYSSDKNHQFRTKLGKAGFHLNDNLVEHPGKLFCKFIILPTEDLKYRYYLEFVNNKGRTKMGAGISLSTDDKLIRQMKKLSSLKPTYIHKNYAWKTNSKDNLPGWNFITFNKHKSNIFSWLTEYEPSKLRKRPKKVPRNPNGVDKIKAFIVELTKEDIKLYTAMLGKPKNSTFKTKNGVEIKYKQAKKSVIKSIAVSAPKFTQVVKKFIWDDLIVYENMPAVLIKNPNKGQWDVIITSEE